MFDARDLLGKLTESGLGRSSQDRLNHAVTSQGSGGMGGGLGQILGGLFGQGGALGGLADQAQGAFGTARDRVKGGDPLALGGLGALAGLVLGGRKGALGGGVLAALGALAYSAMQKSQSASAPAKPEELAPYGLGEPRSHAEEELQQSTALLVIRAMINAAKADGQIDGGEIGRILGKLDETGADAEAKAFVMDSLGKPMETEALIREAQAPAQAIEVYGASLLAIEVDSQAEVDYLRDLALGLRLGEDVVREIHATLGVAAPRQ
ncbi:MAG: tellurite resistance TerB family protein [Hyphomicrobiales bacterium]|nr:tellurite resistance TerB family protein [Hyphomicrobiales bacterium]